MWLSGYAKNIHFFLIIGLHYGHGKGKADNGFYDTIWTDTCATKQSLTVCAGLRGRTSVPKQNCLVLWTLFLALCKCLFRQKMSLAPQLQ